MIYKTVVSGKCQSGKTTNLIGLYKHYESLGYKPMFLTYSSDSAKWLHRTHGVEAKSIKNCEHWVRIEEINAIFIDDTELFDKSERHPVRTAELLLSYYSPNTDCVIVSSEVQP